MRLSITGIYSLTGYSTRSVLGLKIIDKYKQHTTHRKSSVRRCSKMRPTSPSLVNILVPVKRAIDYAVKIRIASDGKGVDTSVKHSMVSRRGLSSQD